MGLILLFFVILIIFIIILEYLMLVIKRTRLIAKLKRACNLEGYNLRFIRPRYLSVFLFKGGYDLLIEGDKGNYAVAVLTSRHRNAKWQINGDRVDIYKTVRLRFGGGIGRTYNGSMTYRRGATLGAYTTRKGSLRLKFIRDMSKYPLHTSICIFNPAPNESTLVDGSVEKIVGDGEMIYPGFTLYGLSGFIRYISSYDEYFGIKM